MKGRRQTLRRYSIPLILQSVPTSNYAGIVEVKSRDKHIKYFISKT